MAGHWHIRSRAEVHVAVSSRISFILKIRVERPDGAQGSSQPTWQGQITHIPSGEKRYVKSMSEITTFIQEHLAALGVPAPNAHPSRQPWWRIFTAPFHWPHRQGGGR